MTEKEKIIYNELGFIDVDKTIKKALQSRDEEIKRLVEEKQMIIKKEGYPASDVIAVLRKDLIEEVLKKINKWWDKKKLYKKDITHFKKINDGDIEELKQKLKENKETNSQTELNSEEKEQLPSKSDPAHQND